MKGVRDGGRWALGGGVSGTVRGGWVSFSGTSGTAQRRTSKPSLVTFGVLRTRFAGETLAGARLRRLCGSSTCLAPRGKVAAHVRIRRWGESCAASMSHGAMEAEGLLRLKARAACGWAGAGWNA